MNFLSHRRIVKLGLANYWRNRWLSLTATSIMTFTLLVISIFVILALAIIGTTESIQSKMDISVYFKDAATTDEIASMQQKLISRSDVKEVKYTSKEEALQIFKTQNKGKTIASLVSSEDNPLPRSLEIRAQSPEDLDKIYEYISGEEFKPGIHHVSYKENKKVIDRLIGLTSFVNIVGWILSVIFVLVSIGVILNTVRLTIFTRKDEVEVMRLVGASDKFIKVPFIIEAILYAIVACIAAIVLIWIGTVSLAPLANNYLGTAVSINIQQFFFSHLMLIFFIQLGIAVLIVITCSLVSIGKYLKI